MKTDHPSCRVAILTRAGQYDIIYHVTVAMCQLLDNYIVYTLVNISEWLLIGRTLLTLLFTPERNNETSHRTEKI